MYAVLYKRSLRIIAFSLMLLCAFLIEGLVINSINNRDIRNPSERIDFLESIGVKVDADSLYEEEIKIPTNFSDVYKQYNNLQKSAGFNLEEYKGITVTKYSYKVLDADNLFVNMLCYKGRVIGGDISSTVLGGEIWPLCKEK